MRKTLNILIILLIMIFNVFLFSFFAFKIKYNIKFKSEIENAALQSGIDKHLIISIAKAESNFNEKAISVAGAIGVMQIIPITAKFVCEINGINYSNINLNNAEDNIMIGALYIRYLKGKFINENVCLAAYNAGEGNVARWLNNVDYSDDRITLKFIPYKETREYVEKVNKNFNIYKKIWN